MVDVSVPLFFHVTAEKMLFTEGKRSGTQSSGVVDNIFQDILPSSDRGHRVRGHRPERAEFPGQAQTGTMGLHGQFLKPSSVLTLMSPWQ